MSDTTNNSPEENTVEELENIVHKSQTKILMTEDNDHEDAMIKYNTKKPSTTKLLTTGTTPEPRVFPKKKKKKKAKAPSATKILASRKPLTPRNFAQMKKASRAKMFLLATNSTAPTPAVVTQSSPNFNKMFKNITDNLVINKDTFKNKVNDQKKELDKKLYEHKKNELRKQLNKNEDNDEQVTVVENKVSPTQKALSLVRSLFVKP